MARKPEERPSAVPTSFPDTTPQLPGGDYSYTVELVGSINRELGHLTAEVAALKEQGKAHSAELRNVSQDIHTAKTVAKIVGGIIAAAIALAGWMIHGGLGDLVQLLKQPSVQTQQK